MINTRHMRRERDNEQYANIRHRNNREEVRDREGWVRNTRIVLLYFFAAFVIIRIWILVAATDNRIYISVTGLAMGILLGFYLRWRRRYIMMLREEYANRQLERDIPVVTIQEFLNIQAAMRAAQNGGVVTFAGAYLPNSMSLLVAALPTIVYQPPVPHSVTSRNHSYQSSMSSFMNGPVGVGSCKVAPAPEPDISIQTDVDLESGGRGELRESQAPLCMICLEYFQAGDILTCLPCACAHKYHRVCLIAWLERKTTCPLCTQSVSQMLLAPNPNTATVPVAARGILGVEATAEAVGVGVGAPEAEIANGGEATNNSNNRRVVAAAISNTSVTSIDTSHVNP